MSETRPYPKGDCIAIYPDGEDTFVACLGEACCEWTVIGHAEKRFIQVFPPNMKHPITITTQIEAIEQRREHIRSAYDGWLENYLKSRKKEKARSSEETPKEAED